MQSSDDIKVNAIGPDSYEDYLEKQYDVTLHELNRLPDGSFLSERTTRKSIMARVQKVMGIETMTDYMTDDLRDIVKSLSKEREIRIEESRKRMRDDWVRKAIQRNLDLRKEDKERAAIRAAKTPNVCQKCGVKKTGKRSKLSSAYTWVCESCKIARKA